MLEYVEHIEAIGIVVKCIICIILMDKFVDLESNQKTYMSKGILVGVNFFVWILAKRMGVLWFILAELLDILEYYIYLMVSKKTKVIKALAIIMASKIVAQIMGLAVSFIISLLDMVSHNKFYSSLLLLGYLLNFILVYLFCVLNKRYKFQQLLKKKRIQYAFVMIGMIFVLAKLMLQIFYDSTENGGNVFLYVALTILVMGIILGTLWLIDWYYDEKEKKLLWEDNRQMSQRIHRSKEIFPALSNALDNLKTDHDTEEVYHILGEIHQLCEEQMEDYKALDSQSKIFPATGIYLLDEQIQVYNTEAGKKGIHFDVFVGEPLSDVLKQRKIKELDFLRLIGDLMRNAFRAIEKKEDGTGNILLVMGVIGDVLQIDIYDDGVAFPLFILDEFGKRGNTEGGTGNGVTDMLELLEKHKATYQLTEYEKEDTFTKGISIIWDGKNGRWIDSYRNSEISNKSILLPKEF